MGRQMKKLVFLVFVLALISVSCGNRVSKKHSVRYEIHSPRLGASLTMTDNQGSTIQLDIDGTGGNLDSKWQRTFTMYSGDHAYLSAQVDGNGDIVCRIYLDGILVKEAASSGKYVICRVSGLVP